MGFLKNFSSSPIAILACLVGGGLAGWVVPAVGSPAFAMGQIYLALVNLAAMPLLVVATFFGLRQTLALPQPVRRISMILVLAIALVSACAVLGAVFGVVVGAGQDVGAQGRSYLGSVVLSASGEATNAELLLFGAADADPIHTQGHWSALIPDNFFRVLVLGQSLGILTCAIVFGLGFAAMGKAHNNVFMGIVEAVYRTFELIISKVNLFIPVLAFGMAAHLSANTDARLLQAMAGFLVSFFAFSVALSLLAAVVIAKNAGTSYIEVLSSLKTAALISLTSASSTASIPDTIRAMSFRLGFSRGIVEMVVPAASVFVRAGAAVYFALLAVFVANIYGQALGWGELLLICVGATMAAFASAGHNSAAMVGAGSMVLSMLNLPVEAALALFLAIDLICEGPRNLLSMMCSCVLIVLVCKGLPSERREAAALDTVHSVGPLEFAFSKRSAFMAIACFSLLAFLIVVAGIGVGQRMGASVRLGNTPISTKDTVVDNPPFTR